MMKAFLRASLLSFLLTALFLSTGCRNRNAPDPSITAVRGGTGMTGGMGQGLDWINPANIARARGEGLEPRDAAFTSRDGGGMGNFIEGLLPSVYFDFDQAAIRPQDRGAVEEAADYLMDNPGSRLLVEGHCDWRGTPEYNLTLGDRRAVSVREFLLQLGVEPDRVETVSKGDLEAVTDGSAGQMDGDRRADLIVVQ